MSKKNTRELCVYCARHPGTTRDHVPPKSLYGEFRPQNLITVPSCLQCNHGKQADDDYLRERLVVDHRTAQSATARSILAGPLTRAALNPYHNRAPLLNTLRWSSLLVPLYNPSGQYLGDFFQTTLDMRRLNTIFSGLTIGLYYHFRRQRLPEDFGVHAYHIEPANVGLCLDHLITHGVRNGYEAGTGEVFRCLYAFGPGTEPGVQSVWLLQFYEQIYYITFTSPLSRFPSWPFDQI